jgi:hypothetical protein
MKKIIITVGLLLSQMGYSQVKIPPPPNSAQFIKYQITDTNSYRPPREGRYFYLTDSCSDGEWVECDSSYFMGVPPGYDNALVATREIYNLIEYYRKKLSIPKEINFFNPTMVHGEEFFDQMVNKAYFYTNNKSFQSREQFHKVLHDPTFAMVGYYELVPNRLKLYFGWSLDGVQYALIDSNKFK